MRTPLCSSLSWYLSDIRVEKGKVCSVILNNLSLGWIGIPKLTACHLVFPKNRQSIRRQNGNYLCCGT